MLQVPAGGLLILVAEERRTAAVSSLPVRLTKCPRGVEETFRGPRLITG